MLLEEALAGASLNSSSSTLRPFDAALALLSFIRDELPAGGIMAENRFVKLFPLIVDRAFGVLIQPSTSETNTAAGSTSTAISSPSQVSQPSSPSSSSNVFYHDDGGWFSLQTRPTQRKQSPNAPVSTQSEQALDSDPIVRLLRAPRCLPLGESSGNHTFRNNLNYPPTLLDALSAESIHRPNVHVKFPLMGLLMDSWINDWKMCFMHEVSKIEIKQGKPSRGVLVKGGTGTVHEIIENFDCVKAPGVIGKENATRILYRLLCAGPEKQVQLRSYFQIMYQQQQERQHGISAQQYSSPFGKLGHSPRLSPTLTVSPLKQRSIQVLNTNSDEYLNIPHVELTMLEYYLLIFLRFPLANSSWQQQLQPPQRGHINRLHSQTYGQRIYSYLFSTYLTYFLPHGVTTDNYFIDVFSDDGTLPATPLNKVDIVGSKRHEGPELNPTSELFLRLVIEFWLEYNVAPTTNDAINNYRRLRRGFSSEKASEPTLRDSLELTKQMQSAMQSPPSHVQIGILTFVRHLVSDIALSSNVKIASDMSQQQQKREREGETSISKCSPIRSVRWCLTPAITASQVSIFNYIRLGLAYGAIHVANSSFHRAFEVWMIWLEPWNYVIKKRSVGATLSNLNQGKHGVGDLLRNATASVTHHRVESYPFYLQPKPTSPSNYSSQWASYVVANINFYTVPLAIFLRRSRELDFSSPTEYPRSFALIQRVLRIYSTPVVNTLNSVLNKRSDAVTNAIVSKHQEILGPFNPPDDWKLKSCQVDAKNLLEDMFGQSQKRKINMDFIDRCEVMLETLFSGAIRSEESTLQGILIKMRELVGLPLDYEPIPETIPKSRSEYKLSQFMASVRRQTDHTLGDFKVPERGVDGKLTDMGRQQIYAGTRKCNALDVHYIGDPMLARYKSYEIPALVDLTISASNYINKKLGFVAASNIVAKGDKSRDDLLSRHLYEMEQFNKVVIRVNLRFLADYRNIIFISICMWLLKASVGLFGT